MRVRRWDDKVMAGVAAAESPLLDRLLPRLGRAADHGLLWFAVAAALAASRRRPARRAALRGAGSLALASATVNLAAKGLARRTRPETGGIPLIRRLRRAPITTSFPSGHSASAAAFATAVALEAPALAAPVSALAAGVAASRVVTGAHYPSDVLAGMAIGAAAATITVRWWPLRPDRPAAAARPRAEAPALPTGDGLVVVVNALSGGASEDLVDRIVELLPDADVVIAADGDDVAKLLREAAGRATALGVAGGDGTMNAAAAIAVEHRLPLWVVPAGTLNHFARDVGVESVEDAAAALRGGYSVAVDLGVAGDVVFLNTTSVGIYVELVRAREKWERRLGKWPATVVGLAEVLVTGRPQEVVLDGERRRLWLLFAGNGAYEPQGFAPSYRPSLRDGLLDVRIVDAKAPLARLRLVVAVLLGTLGRSRVYEAYRTSTIRLSAADGELTLSRDGELTDTPHTVRLSKQVNRLVVYRPDPG